MDINYTRTEHFLAISRHLTIRLYGIYIQHPGFHPASAKRTQVLKLAYLIRPRDLNFVYMQCR
jgi:hypothetical protein